MKVSRLMLLIYLSVAFILSGCTTSRSIVSNNVNLEKYRYASIINNDTYHIPAELMAYDIQLFDAVEESGLELVSDWRIQNLSTQEQEKLLLVKYGVSVTQEETIVTVNFIDFMTGRPVVSCRGASSSLGFSSSADMKGAIKNVAKQISETFRK